MLSTATRVAELCGGRRQGGDPMLSGVCIDSRRVRFGDLFIALSGENTNGHDFVSVAEQQGAAAAMVQLPVSAKTQIVVGDCEQALVKLASGWRNVFAGRAAAVTGSNGKTTVKEMLAAICRAAAGDQHVFSTHGNMNNRLGLSLAVLELQPHHQYAVLETGMDAPGELLELGGICRPHVAIVNNAQRAHLGGFASVADIARAKGELIETLPPDGVAVLNAADQHISLWRKLAGKRKVLSFGFDQDADFRGEIRGDALHFPNHSTPVKLQVPGAHNLGNALAAAAAASVMSLPPESVVNGLSSFNGVAGRLQHQQLSDNILLIDDTYNANPDSLLAGLKVLSECQGEKFAALGDMLALGESSAAEHAAAVAAADAMNIRLFAVGEQMKAAAGARGFADKESLVQELMAQLKACQQGAVLVKGSRGMQMETVVRMLKEGAEQAFSPASNKTRSSRGTSRNGGAA